MKKIVLIEDNLEMRENTSEMLELANYEVLTAANGKEGVELVKKELPDLVICDVMMPVLDGHGVLYYLNKDPKTVTIPFIFLTAKAERSDFRIGMNLGADDYLTKPYTEIELMDAVEVRLKKIEEFQEKYQNTNESIDQFLKDVQSYDDMIELSTEKIKKYKKKEAVFHESDYPTGVYVVRSGRLKAFKMNPEGKEYIVQLYGEGDFIGYTSLLEDVSFNYGVVALENAELGFIPKSQFFQMMFNNKEIAQRFIGLLASNVKDKEERLLNLAYNSVRKRVAQALVLLEDRYRKQEGEEFSMAISREDLASIVGTSTESVIRTLSDFKQEGHVSMKGSKVTILNSEGLRTLKF